MKKIFTKEIKAALLAIFVIISFVWVINFLKGINFFKSGSTYYVIYNDVSGIVNGTPVRINGQKIGAVKDIYFHPNATGQSVVEFFVETELPLYEGTVAEMKSDGFLDAKSIVLDLQKNSDKLLKENDTLPAKIQTSLTTLMFNELDPLKKQITTTLSDLDTVLVNFAAMTDKNMQNNIGRSLNQLNTALESFAKTSNSLNTLVNSNSGNIDKLLVNFNGTAEQLETFSTELNELPLDDLVNNLNTTVNETKAILAQLSNKKGSMGKLLNDDKLYNNMENSLKELELLLKNMRENPKRYVHFSLFGKKNKPYIADDNKEMKQ